MIQSKVFEQVINIMADAIEDMDIEIEQKDIRREFLEKKIGLPDFKIVEKMNKLRLNKISSKRKRDRIIDRLKITLNNHKYIKNKKAIKLKNLNKSFVLIMTCLQKQLRSNYLFVYLFLYTTTFVFVKLWHILVVIIYGEANFIILSLN